MNQEFSCEKCKKPGQYVDFVDRHMNFSSLDEDREKIIKWTGKICLQCDQDVVNKIVKVLHENRLHS